MQNDPVFKETQARIQYLKLKNLTDFSNFGRNSLARKLVADKEWKQLDKFTKLMEMIMYLQDGILLCHSHKLHFISYIRSNCN